MKPSRICLFATIVLVQFFVFEVGLRLRGGSEAAPVFQQLFQQDPVTGFRLRPGASARFKTSEFETDIVINAAGVRDEEIGPKNPDERRIVVLGDSLVLAVQVPFADTFCQRLQMRLNATRSAGAPRYRVINAGVQGYGPVEELAFFEHVARHFEPDLVLVVLYVNDVVEAAATGQALLPASGTATSGASGSTSASIAARPSPWPLWMRRVVRRSMVLQTLRLRWMSIRSRFGTPNPIDPALTLFLPTLPSDIARGLAITRECVRRISALASAQGARTAIVLLPARFQIVDDDFAALKAIVAESHETLVRDAGTARFATTLAALPEPLFDALPTLRNTPRRAEMYFRGTAHLTVLGHETLASGIERFLLDAGLVQPRGRVAH